MSQIDYFNEEKLSELATRYGIQLEDVANILMNIQNLRRNEAVVFENADVLTSHYTTRDVYLIYRVMEENSFSYACTCPAFNTGKVSSLHGMAVCKHIKDKLTNRDIPLPPRTVEKKASPYQRMEASFLLGNNAPKDADVWNKYTANQMYSVVRYLLDRNGISYAEMMRFLRSDNQSALVPYLSFGIEVEGGGMSDEEAKRLLQQIGYAGIVSTSVWNVYELGRYLSDLARNQSNSNEASSRLAVFPSDIRELNKNICTVFVGKDASVSVVNGKNYELKTGRLIGVRGPGSLASAINLLKEMGKAGYLRVNKTCGLHVHVGVSGWTRSELARLASAWYYHQDKLMYLVPEHRRDNQYAKLLSQSDLGLVKRGSFASCNKYRAINFKKVTMSTEEGGIPLATHNSTVEYRLHNGVGINPDDPNSPDRAEMILASWVIFCLKFSDAARRGLIGNKPRESHMGFEELLDTINIRNNSVLMANVRNHLLWKYEFFRCGRSSSMSTTLNTTQQGQNLSNSNNDSVQQAHDEANGVRLSAYEFGDRVYYGLNLSDHGFRDSNEAEREVQNILSRILGERDGSRISRGRFRISRVYYAGMPAETENSADNNGNMFQVGVAVCERARERSCFFSINHSGDTRPASVSAINNGRRRGVMYIGSSYLGESHDPASRTNRSAGMDITDRRCMHFFLSQSSRDRNTYYMTWVETDPAGVLDSNCTCISGRIRRSCRHINCCVTTVNEARNQIVSQRQREQEEMEESYATHSRRQ